MNRFLKFLPLTGRAEAVCLSIVTKSDAESMKIEDYQQKSYK
jgi:hypothetical protein